MKNKLLILLLVLFTILTVSGCKKKAEEPKENETITVKEKSEYQKILEKGNFKPWEYQQVLDALIAENDFSGIIWFATEENGWSKKIIPVYASLGANGIDDGTNSIKSINIYYVDTTQDKDENIYANIISLISEELTNIGCVNENGEPEILTPTTIFMKRGSLIGIETLANTDTNENKNLTNEEFMDLYNAIHSKAKEIYSYK